MHFAAIDFETANADFSSICQIGIASFCDGALTSCWQSLVNPEDEFSSINVFLHGINEETVRDSPTFPQVFSRLQSMLTDRIVVSHTAFDRVAMQRVLLKYRLPEICCTWLDSACVARRAWPREFARSGYGLARVAECLGIEFQHHNAQEDASAAGEILIRAITATSISVADWLTRVQQPIFLDADGKPTGRISRDGDPDGPLYGETLVFTGALCIPRREAAELAAEAGCAIGDGVNTATTILVVGDQDVRKLAGHTKSNKHRKAEELISKGQAIRIVSESDFKALVGM